MLADRRRNAILELVRQQGSVRVTSLATELQVSESTIRRDLIALDSAGRLHRVRGGGSVEVDIEPFDEVADRAREEKARIAEYADSLVHDRSVVLLDIGTTCAAVARQLRGRNLTVVTASLAVADELRNDRNIELVLLGGVLRPSYHSLVGPLTQHAISQLRADIAFVGASGVRDDGMVLDSTGIEVPVKHAIIQNSDRTCLVASRDKFPGSGLLPVGELKEFSDVITSLESAHPTLNLVKNTTEVHTV